MLTSVAEEVFADGSYDACSIDHHAKRLVDKLLTKVLTAITVNVQTEIPSILVSAVHYDMWEDGI